MSVSNIIPHLSEKGYNNRAINCRETARRRVRRGSTPHAPTAVGNINSGATGNNISWEIVNLYRK